MAITSGVLATAAIGAGVSAAITVATSLATAEDKTVFGPRSDRLNILNAQEGSAIPICFGPRNRIGGTVLWLPKLTEVQREDVQDTGGLTASSTQTTIFYTYFADIAVAVCEGEIASITKIFANGRLLWTPPGVTLITAIDAGNGGPLVVSLLDISVFLGGWGRMLITSPVGGIDLNIFTAGKKVTISGYTNAENNGTLTLTRVGTNPDGTTFLNLRNPLGAVPETPTNPITISQVNLGIPDGAMTSFTQYPGSLTQAINSTISDQESEVGGAGTGKTPAYRRTAYGVCQGLALNEYGNRVPQLTFEVEAQSSLTLDMLITKLFERAGFVAADLDVTDLTGINISGYTLTSPISLKKALDPVILAYDLVVQDQASKLKFFQRANASEITIAEEDLACHEFGQDAPRVAEIIDESNDLLPREVAVSYLDTASSLQAGSQRERRVDNSIGSDTILRLDIPLAMSAGQARNIANRELWRLWQSRQRLNLELPPSYMHLQEGDIINLLIAGITYKAFITDIEIGNNFLMKVRSVIQHGPPAAAILGEDSIYGDSEPATISPLQFSIWDYAPINGLHHTTPGMYGFVARTDIQQTWQGAYVLASFDDIEFGPVAYISVESTMGYTTDVLANADYGYPDLKNTINVAINSNLSSVSDDDFYKGKNRAIIGGEVIAFKNAVLQSDGTYTLSVLLRGLRDTASDMSGHVSLERCLIIKSPFFLGVSDSLNNYTHHLKVIPQFGDPDDVESLAHQFRLGTMTPFKVAHFIGIEDGSGTINYSWYRRGRADYLRLFSPVPLEEGADDRYEIDLLHPTLGLVRSVGTNIMSLAYTAAERAADGFVATEIITAKIYQIHAVYGRMTRYKSTTNVE